jgi:MFS transporter, Spinster family, sphingosine-1-phosphate transporter
MEMTPSPAAAQDPKPAALPGSRAALTVLLAINLFNYLDRFILVAVEPNIRAAFFAKDDPNAMGATGLLATAFLVSYMVAAPIFGYLADRMSRWLLIGIAVGLWSLASGASGLAASFMILLLTRVFVGIGEGGYGPAAPTLISDYFPMSERGRKMAYFYMAIPVGSALGYVFGGIVAARLGWRWPFYLVTIPGLILAVVCLLRRDPRERAAPGTKRRAPRAEYGQLLRIPSFIYNTVAMTAWTFAIGGIAFWVPSYLHEYRGLKDLEQVNTMFGAITVVAGFAATLCGGWLGDKLRERHGGSYFLVSGAAMLIAVPLFIAMLYVPFPLAWGLLAVSVFFLFFNMGPSNTALANVTPPSIRATAFALNIFCIHLLGDAFAPPVIGFVAGRTNFNIAFLLVGVAMLAAGIVWLVGAKHLKSDTDAASAQELAAERVAVVPAA